MRKIWLSRHGESQYNTLARLGGDSPLSSRGEVYAYKLPDVLVDRVPLVRTPVFQQPYTLKPKPRVPWEIPVAIDRHGLALPGLTFSGVNREPYTSRPVLGPNII